MNLPLWAGLVVATLVIALVAETLVSAYLRMRGRQQRWKHLVGPFSFSYDSSGYVDGAVLAEAVRASYDALVSFGPWPAEKAKAALQGVKIYVSDEEAWKTVVCTSDCAETTVAGATLPDANMVVVNPSLTSLAHELAHICEVRIDGGADYTHDSWVKRGLSSAMAVYARGQPAA